VSIALALPDCSDLARRNWYTTPYITMFLHNDVLCGRRAGFTIRNMPTLIPIPRASNPPQQAKVIEEYVGRVHTSTAESAWLTCTVLKAGEPAQTPEFDEYTLVLRGTLRVHHKSGEIDVSRRQASSRIAASGSLFNAIFWRRRVYRSVPSSLFASDRPSRLLQLRCKQDSYP